MFVGGLGRRPGIARRSASMRSITQQPITQVYGLEFPSNTDSPASTMVAFRFTGSNAPSAYPATYVWKCKFRTQNSVNSARYFTTFFWADTTITGFVASGYYGFHPYPDPTVNSTTAKFEISTDGQDPVGASVTMGQLYTQAAVVRLVNTDELELIYYTDLAGVGVSQKITYTSTSNWATTFPNGASPGIVFGDAPWSVDAERMSGTLGPVKIFNANLSEADIEAEAGNMTQIVTSAGSANRWWFKPTFDSADDLTDSVTSKSASWYNANKATRVLLS